MATLKPLALQHIADASRATLWEQTFSAAVWRPVIGERAVVLEAEGEDITLVGARAGRRRELGAVRNGRRTLQRAELAEDWLWLEGRIRSATWRLETALDLPPVTAVIPTYRREDDALAQAERFLEMEVVTEVLVVDQGGTLAQDPRLRRLLAHEERLRLVTQPNLGGSGGYARGMLEAGRNPGAAVLFSDDDAVISGESLRRMLAFQTLAPRPTILGAPLFSSKKPQRLLAHSETVDTRTFNWRPTGLESGPMNLRGTTPVDWGALAPSTPATYTGWWGTLFPPGTAADLGLPLPLFLKWDDAEYGLRATARGYDHAVLPGTAVHHPPWNAHITQMSWPARLLHRNRLAVAAGSGAGRGVIVSSFAHQCKHVLAGHLLTAELWEAGIDEFRAGPDAWLGDDQNRARSEGERIVEAWHHECDFPSPVAPTHTSPRPLPIALGHALLRLSTPDRAPRVTLRVPSKKVRWTTTMGADAVQITRGGTPLEAYRVRGSHMRRALARSIASHLDLALRWGALRRRYRRALPQHTTVEAWTALFADAAPGTPTGRD
ncbi:glycosyltransferase family 2 protein [Brachybacterium aquaticum]|uniref:Galactofuranosylgalactofuranosylrhamnosyl-N-acetylglucosaminyl-diphospho-decaprenol beta-1,5/1,6-galactofuranosyltransferase n=1 Tax=Brachybacterium aquaticum TaxID=1432564 RepID=A0A841AAJ2_9MICO|nr:glycosyltransferase [Brachybacterium aquaticum]MBB5830385.1 galactofuranosylgalactofuranosylrhamnosyl-N-acetylglucosaminyl-diphospho-decaprenol beta-1,5/1,6-galactofuranosyltransferase [Brachybacterium aquaticum]